MGQRVAQFLDATDGTSTLAGLSVPIFIGHGMAYEGVPLTVKIYDISGLTCTIEGCLTMDETSTPPAFDSAEWVTMGEAITTEKFEYVPSSVTFIRINASAGSCKARIKY